MGKGFPDLLVWSRVTRRYYLMEVKDGSKSESRRKLTPAQIKFHQQCPESYVVKTLKQALDILENKNGR